jgi:hypothetical protein
VLSTLCYPVIGLRLRGDIAAAEADERAPAAVI